MDRWHKTNTDDVERGRWNVLFLASIDSTWQVPLPGRWVTNWKPNGMPDLIKSHCEERNIRFVDTTDAMRAAAKEGKLVCNPIFDTHLNEEGSRVVGELLARTLQETASDTKP